MRLRSSPLIDEELKDPTKLTREGGESDPLTGR